MLMKSCWNSGSKKRPFITENHETFSVWNSRESKTAILTIENSLSSQNKKNRVSIFKEAWTQIY